MGRLRQLKPPLRTGLIFWAVARISEAVQLREAGLTLPILLLGEVLPEQVTYLAANGIRASIGDIQTAKAVSDAALAANLKVKVHIKLDTGMGRLGFIPEDMVADNGAASCGIRQADLIASLKGLEVEGVYTHFAKADIRGQKPCQRPAGPVQQHGVCAGGYGYPARPSGMPPTRQPFLSCPQPILTWSARALPCTAWPRPMRWTLKIPG